MKPNVGDLELKLVKEVIKSGNLVEGKMVREFEDTVKSFIGVEYAIACTSATTGLELTLRALKIGVGDEVIVPDFTHPASALVVQTVGASPIIIDVDIESYNTTASMIEEAITENTKAIMPVSIFGNPLDMDPIMVLGDKYGIPIVEDAACSLGSIYKGKKVGAMADMTVFSFHPRKVFTTGDGGLIVTNNEDYANLIVSMKKFGVGVLNGKSTFVRWGTNYRMSDILGAVALAQSKRIEQIVKSRIQKAKIYNNLLNSIDEIVVPKIEEHSTSNFQTYAILLKTDNRDLLLNEMRKRGIEVQIGTYALHLLPVFYGITKFGNMKNSELLYNNLLALPIHASLTENEQHRVVDCIKELLGEYK